MLDQVLHTARHSESVGRVVELLEDETSFNSNAPDEITRGDQMRSRAQNFTIGNGYRTTTPTRSHSTEDPTAISYNNHGIGEALHGEL